MNLLVVDNNNGIMLPNNQWQNHGTKIEVFF